VGMRQEGAPGGVGLFTGRLAAVTLLAAAVSVSATVFGIGFAPEAAHGHAAEEATPAGGHGAEEAGGGGQGEEHAMEEEHAEDEEGAGAGAITSSILISLAAGAVVPLAFAARRREPEAVGVVEPAESPHTVARATLVAVALLSLGAAVIHFAVIAQHFDEWWLTGLFFVSIAVFQVAWALLVLVRPSPPVYLAGAVVNALIVVTWIVSRTTGVPVGPEAGEPEAVGFPDTLASAFEVVLVVALAALVSDRAARRPLSSSTRAAGSLGSAAVVVSLTAAALAVLA
jgi:Na+-transporting methylmalonyl-CoA/oxaloacetate decarboxylase gamma subunit